MYSAVLVENTKMHSVSALCGLSSVCSCLQAALPIWVTMSHRSGLSVLRWGMGLPASVRGSLVEWEVQLCRRPLRFSRLSQPKTRTTRILIGAIWNSPFRPLLGWSMNIELPRLAKMILTTQCDGMCSLGKGDDSLVHESSPWTWHKQKTQGQHFCLVGTPMSMKAEMLGELEEWGRFDPRSSPVFYCLCFISLWHAHGYQQRTPMSECSIVKHFSAYLRPYFQDSQCFTQLQERISNYRRENVNEGKKMRLEMENQQKLMRILLAV